MNTALTRHESYSEGVYENMHFRLVHPVDNCNRGLSIKKKYEEKIDYEGFSLSDTSVPDKDYVLLSKTNISPKKSLVVLGGLHHIGTEKAGEYLRKHWKSCYDELNKGGKDVELLSFSMCIYIKGDDADVVSTYSTSGIPSI